MSYQKNIELIIKNIDLNQHVPVYQFKYDKHEVMNQTGVKIKILLFSFSFWSFFKVRIFWRGALQLRQLTHES